jgi:hypothetical protein
VTVSPMGGATRGGAEVDADECSDPDHLTEEACGENQPAQVSCLHRPYRVREEAVALTETRSPRHAATASGGLGVLSSRFLPARRSWVTGSRWR